MLNEGEYYWIKSNEDSPIGPEWMVGLVSKQEGQSGEACFFLAGNEVEYPSSGFEIGQKVISHDELVVPAGVFMKAQESLLDQFAMTIATTLISRICVPVMPSDIDLAAKNSYRFAEAMMKAREGK